MTTISIRSFSDPAIDYDVTDTSCSCPHSRIQGAMCKHRILRDCLLKARSLRFGKYAAEEGAVRIVKAVFAKTKDTRRSYRAFMDASFSRVSTPELMEIARLKHRSNVLREVA